MTDTCSRGLVWGLVLALGMILLVARGQLSAQTQGHAAETLRLLQARAAAQAQAARDYQAFHDFRFTDRMFQSRIRFRNRIVDDAGKDWKAAHYDHGNSVAAADVDGDGLVDLYFVTALGSNQLWRNLGRGKFEPITASAGVGMEEQISVAASFGDIDNDGDPDLYVTTVRHGNVLFENRGRGRFREITAEAGLSYSGHSSGAMFFDFDNDGLLDLFLTNVGRYTEDNKGRGGFYLALSDAFSGHMFPERTEYSILYRNLGGRKFQDVSRKMNLRDGSWSGDATFCDLNGDRFPDVYVVNMQGADHYYENVAGKRFVDRTAQYFPRTSWGAMGMKFFDYNNDSRMDLYVVDMHSDMTDEQRVKAMKLELSVEKGKSEAFCGPAYGSILQSALTNYFFGNCFYENRGAGKFVERSDALGLETYWPWGMSVADLNADGFEDVFVSAGMGFPFRYGINSVLLNEAGRTFFDAEFLLGIEPRLGGKIEIDYLTLDCDGADKGHRLCGGKAGKVIIRGPTSTRSSVIFDLDDDGDLDIVTNEFNDRSQVLFSNLTSRRKIRFLKVALVGTVSNRDGLGATVQVHAGNRVFTRYHDGKSGYLSQSSLPLYFGLGDAGAIDRVEVRWPSGRRQVVTDDIPVNGRLQVTEPGR